MNEWMTIFHENSILIIAILLLLYGLYILIFGHAGHSTHWLLSPDNPHSNIAWASLFILGSIVLFIIYLVS